MVKRIKLRKDECAIIFRNGPGGLDDNRFSIKAYVRLFGKAGTVMRVIFQSVKCKHCGSKDIVKYGSLHGVQRWFCNKCHRKFVDNYDDIPCN